jgi:hypothetical protein
VVKGTWVRGRAVYRNDGFLGLAQGRLLTPQQSNLPKT